MAKPTKPTKRTFKITQVWKPRKGEYAERLILGVDKSGIEFYDREAKARKTETPEAFEAWIQDVEATL